MIVPSLFLVVGPAAVRTGDRERSAAPHPVMDPGPPRINAKRAATLSEREIIDYLATPETTNEEIARLLEALGRFDRSHDAVASLIRWLEFEDWGGRTEIRNNEFIPLPQPAEVSLKRIGVFAVPQLVDEYVFFFENTSISARAGRYGGLQADQRGNILEVQNYGYRLSCLAVILSATPEVATRAVECAWDRMAAQPEDDHVQRACRALSQMTNQFHFDDRARLFTSPAYTTLPDLAALVPLLDDWLPDQDRARQIADLAQFDDSPVVVSQLIQWLEFRPTTKGFVKIGEDDDRPDTINAYPAAVALTRIGPFAVSQLVGEYVHFFENTDVEANRRRQYVRLLESEWGKPQSPAHRLALLVTVLSKTPRTAQAAVALAQKRMWDKAADDRTQRACEALIADIVIRFPEIERAKLFPAAALSK